MYIIIYIISMLVHIQKAQDLCQRFDSFLLSLVVRTAFLDEVTVIVPLNSLRSHQCLKNNSSATHF